MRADFFKLEIDEELIDVMNVRVVEQKEIEIFVLTQLIGIMELLERKVMLTSQSKRGMLSYSVIGELEDMGADEDLLELLYEATRWKGQLTEVPDEIVEKAKTLKEVLIKQLDVRLHGERKEKEEWVKLYDLSIKQLRMLHDSARQWQMDQDDCGEAPLGLEASE